jgi:threonine aldolase
MTDKSQQFASDNYSGICPEAWAAMEQANHGHQRAYGDDEWTARASDYFRKLFETDCEVFFAFNGTAANSLALSSLCQSYHSVICSETAHVETDECGAPEFFSNGSKLLIARTENGKLTPESIREVALKRQDIHYPKPRVVTLTQATEVGSVYTPDEIRAISATCIGGTKNGMAVGEAILFFNHKLAEDFDYRCKQAGQLASKMRFLSAPWVGILENDAWLKYANHANRCAQLLAELVSDIPGVELMFPVQANGVFLQLSEPAIAALTAKGWRFYTFIGNGGARFMCSWDTEEERVRELARDIREVMSH